MLFTSDVQQICTHILHEELRVAMGCTEPIALAYGAAYVRRIMGRMPRRFTVKCSGNIIKNVKAVTVPNTGGLKGIETAVLAGAVSGRNDLELEVLSVLDNAQREELHRLMAKHMVDVELLESDHPLHIIIEAYHNADAASVEIIDSHTGLGDIVHNGQILHRRQQGLAQQKNEDESRRQLSVNAILEYADTVNLTDVQEELEQQIACNSAISREGLENPWGECVGKTLYSIDKEDIKNRILAVAAAGSDARMNGCALPVVINSGSGNQGMTASLPVIEYAKSIEASHEELLRALCVSNLVSIHQKTDIGKLSAYCGVVCAATGSVAGIAYLDDQPYQIIENTIINSICSVGGMVCDGAKSSCAAKITSALNSALLAYEMAKKGHVFRPGEGLVKEDVEKTIASVGRMAAKGMKCTDNEILNIMIDK